MEVGLQIGILRNSHSLELNISNYSQPQKFFPEKLLCPPISLNSPLEEINCLSQRFANLTAVAINVLI